MGKCDNAIPAYDHDNMTHWFIWTVMAYKFTDEDFEAIEYILKQRKKDHKRINKSSVFYHEFDEGKGMYQPRSVPDFIRDGAHEYVDWSSAMDICMILSKYAKFFSKLD